MSYYGIIQKICHVLVLQCSSLNVHIHKPDYNRIFLQVILRTEFLQTVLIFIYTLQIRQFAAASPYHYSQKHFIEDTISELHVAR